MSTELWKRALAGLGLVSVLTAACSGSNAPSPFASPGGRLYLQQCAGCHGAQVQGGVGPPLNATGHAHHHPDIELIEAMTNGISRPGQAVAMPGFGERLSAEQVRQIVDFVKTQWTPEQRAQQQALNPQ